MTSMNDQDLLELGKKVHNLFDEDDRYHVSVYGLGWESGEVEDLKHYYCHAGLMKVYGGVKLVKGRGPVVISNQVQTERKSLDKKDREKFFSFLFTESVFADCYVTQDPGKCDEDGITVRTDSPANLVVAACIATRQAWEYPDIGKTVLRLIKFGVEPRKAHLAAHVITVDKDGGFKNSWRDEHIAVYARRMGKKAVSNFLSGTLSGSIPLNLLTYRKAQDYKDIPKMWGEKSYNSLDVYGGDVGTLPSEYSSDPFKFIKQVGNIGRVDVVRAVEEAFERILK